jgi:hypothetical protein
VVDHRRDRHLVVRPQLALERDRPMPRPVERADRDPTGEDVRPEVEQLLLRRVRAGDEHRHRRARDAGRAAQPRRQAHAVEVDREQLHRRVEQRRGAAPRRVHLVQRRPELVGLVPEQEARPVQEQAGADEVHARGALVAGVQRGLAEPGVPARPVAPDAAPVRPDADLALDLLEVPVGDEVGGDAPGEQAVHRLQVAVAVHGPPSWTIRTASTIAA